MKWLQKLFYGAPFEKKHRISKTIVLWTLEGKPGAVVKVRVGGSHVFAKLTETDLAGLIDTADEILKTEGKNK